MIDRFITVKARGEAEIVERKSRFIGTCVPVSGVEQANEFLDEMKKKYYDATHNVFAYQIGEHNEHIRQSDDGEPSGTAGLPVLDVLRNENLKNVVINVTRYFGGTLLGTGGLVRAYGHAARQAVSDAGIVTMVLNRELFVACSYPISGKIQFETLKEGHVIKDTQYAENVVFTVLVEEPSMDMYVKMITDITSGAAEIRTGEFVYCDA